MDFSKPTPMYLPVVPGWDKYFQRCWGMSLTPPDKKFIILVFPIQNWPIFPAGWIGILAFGN